MFGVGKDLEVYRGWFERNMLEFCLLLQVNGDLGEMCNDLMVNYGRDA